ncbi:MAG: four-carbon acid sugar kinase family protein [Paracoccaceae bacterium]
MTLPDGPLIAFVGDDFTGSAATMEVLSFAGLPTVLFVAPPTKAQAARFGGMRGIGIATTARSQSPDWMARHLPPLFAHLAATGAPLLHYKTCSTLDSAPHTGSIGKAVELALAVRGSDWVSCLIAAPPLRRYQAFGQLFAAAGDAVYRLDRHPVMASHPVTPMQEADVAMHLRKQTDLPLATLTLEHLNPTGLASLRANAPAKIITLDCIDMDHAAQLGALIWDAAGADGHLAIGSQGVEYALVAHWQKSGLIPPPEPAPSFGKVDHVIAISGSVSPTTAAQIARAEEDGFVVIPLDAAALIKGGDSAKRAMTNSYEAARAALSQGRDPLICSARGPDDPAVAAMRAALSASQHTPHEANALIGTSLGALLRDLLRGTGVARAIIAGGDTSGFAAQALGLFALTAIGATTAGAALLKGHSDTPEFDGLELALKGGQMGSPDYFSWIKNGARAEAKG